MNLALFDLDNTLLAGDSDYEWAQFLIAKGVVDAKIHAEKNEDFFEHYKAGTLDIHAFGFSTNTFVAAPACTSGAMARRIHARAHSTHHYSRRASVGRAAHRQWRPDVHRDSHQ